MKKLIKAVIPEKIIRRAVSAQDHLQLSGEKTLTLRKGNLRSVENIALKTLLAVDASTRLWDEDKARIRKVFGDEDTLEGVNPGDRRALYTLVMGLKPQKVLEVGTHIGASTIHIAMAMKAAGITGKIVSADILDVNDPQNGSWKRVGMAKPPIGFMRDLGCADMIEFHTGPCLDYMKRTSERFDLIFLDGDHHARAVYQEFSAALLLLAVGGVIVLHDYYPDGKALYEGLEPISGPYLAMERVMRENPNVLVLSLGTLPWPTKAGSCATTLAMVVKRR